MSNTIAKHSESDPGKNQPSPEPKKTVNKVKASHSAKPVAILSLVLSLAALGAVSYIGWRGMAIEKQLPDTTAHIRQLDNQLSRQSSQLISTKESLAPIQQQANQLEQRGERLLNRVDQLSGKVRSLEGSTRMDWHLAEIEYLLRLANQRLLMSSDIQGAKTLLTSADEMLRTLDNYDLYSVREALAEDMAVLNDIPAFDQEGSYLRLQALGEQTQSLKLLEVDQFNTSGKATNDPIAETSPDEQTWQSKAMSALLYAWQGFTDLFRFTSSRERPIEILLTPEQESIVRQNLSLLIEQSKLSLLARQQLIYKDSLTQAEQWLKKYFSRSGSASKAVLTELSELAAMDIDPSLPNINRALEALKHYQLQPASPSNNLSKTQPEFPESRRKNSVLSPPVDISTGIDAESEEPRS